MQDYIDLIVVDIGSFVHRYFSGNVNMFLDFLDKNDILEDGEIRDSFLDWLPMYYYNYICNKDFGSFFENYLIPLYSDLSVSGDTYWLKISDRQDLSVLFEKDSRNYSVRTIAYEILGEDFPNLIDYDCNYMDIANDILDWLDDENLTRLQEVVFESYSKLDGAISREDFYDLSNRDLSELIKEEELDVLSDLCSLYINSMESAWYSQMYEKVMSELSSFFELDEFYIESKSGININITKIIEKAINDFIDVELNSSYDEFNSHYGFINILEYTLSETNDQLSLNTDFYVSCSDKEYIVSLNDYFDI